MGAGLLLKYPVSNVSVVLHPHEYLLSVPSRLLIFFPGLLVSCSHALIHVWLKIRDTTVSERVSDVARCLTKAQCRGYYHCYSCPPAYWDKFLLLEFSGSCWVLALSGAVCVLHRSCSVAALAFRCVSTSALIAACHLARLIQIEGGGTPDGSAKFRGDVPPCTSQ